VRNPGAYPIEDGKTMRISDVLALAGGLNLTANEEGRINITRVGTGVPTASGVSATVEQPRTWSIDPAALVDDSDMRENAMVQDGDLINVTAVPRIWTVTVGGEVVNEGGYEVRQGDSIPSLIAKAGGPTELASLKNVTVQRGGKEYSVDVLSAYKNGTPLDFKLQQGDYVSVPKNTKRVLVMPAVNKAGYVPMPEDGPLTIGEAISLAGGPKNGARIFEIARIRPTADGGMDKKIINLAKTDGRGSMGETLNEPLQPGDIVFVPEGKQGTTALSGVSRVLPFLRIFGF
jgi:protein involved in polysaccharide export with SLBB domain